MAVVACRRPRAVRPGSFLFEQRSCFFVRFGFIPFQVDLSPRRARDERQAAGGARGSLWKGAEGTLEKEEEEERGDKKTVAKKTQLSFSLSCLLQNTPCPASRLPPRATAAAAPDAAAAVRASLKHQRRQRRWRRSRLPLLGGRGRSRQQQQRRRRRRRRQVPPDLLRRRRRSTPPPPPPPASSSHERGMSANEFRDALHARVIRSGMLDDVKVQEGEKEKERGRRMRDEGSYENKTAAEGED